MAKGTTMTWLTAEFLTVITVHLLAVISPGPDFAYIIRQSVNLGRKHAIIASIGIACGILVHVTYSLIGVGVIVATTPTLLIGLKLIAAGYFLYIAWHGLRAMPQSMVAANGQGKNAIATLKQSFIGGFLINALNIKATLFFVALYSIVVSSQTPFHTQLSYGIYMVFATGVWFSLLSYLLSMEKVRQRLIQKGYWVERLMGLVLLIVAIDILLTIEL